MLHILGACKEGSRSVCRPLIDLPGWFLKSEQGGQLLAVVGIDGDNYMFSVAWTIVDVYNKRNWE